MVLNALRAGTAELHKEVEAATLGGRLNSSLSLLDYRRIIRWQYLAHLQLESASAIGQTGFSYQKRLPVLRTDLESLSESSPEGFIPIVIPATYAAGLGLLYVLIGSSLGGAMIHKVLLKNEQLTAAQPFHFYKFQGEKGTKEWRAFLQLLKEARLTSEEVEESVATAQKAFRVFEESWVSAGVT